MVAQVDEAFSAYIKSSKETVVREGCSEDVGGWAFGKLVKG